MLKKLPMILKRKQEELLAETLKKIDIVICTALIPGKKAPVNNQRKYDKWNATWINYL